MMIPAKSYQVIIIKPSVVVLFNRYDMMYAYILIVKLISCQLSVNVSAIHTHILVAFFYQLSFSLPRFRTSKPICFTVILFAFLKRTNYIILMNSPAYLA